MHFGQVSQVPSQRRGLSTAKALYVAHYCHQLSLQISGCAEADVMSVLNICSCGQVLSRLLLGLLHLSTDAFSDHVSCDIVQIVHAICRQVQ